MRVGQKVKLGDELGMSNELPAAPTRRHLHFGNQNQNIAGLSLVPRTCRGGEVLSACWASCR